MSNLYPKTTGANVTRPNGTTAEQMFTALPEIIMGTTKMESGSTYTLSKSYTQFKYLIVIYAPFSDLVCCQTMLLPTQFVNNQPNQYLLTSQTTANAYAMAQIGFTNENTLKVQSIGGVGNYPDTYVRICGIK